MECAKRTISYDYLIIDVDFLGSSKEWDEKIFLFYKELCRKNAELTVLICGPKGHMYVECGTYANLNNARRNNVNPFIVRYEDNSSLFSQISNHVNDINKCMIMKFASDIEFQIDNDTWTSLSLTPIEMKDIIRIEKAYNKIFDENCREIDKEYELTYKNSKLLYREYRYSY